MPHYVYFYTLLNLQMRKNIKSLFTSKGDLFLLSILISLPLYFILDANNQFWGLIPLSGSVTILVYTILATLITFFLLYSVFGALEKTVVILTVYFIWYLFFKTIRVKLGSIITGTLVSNLGYYLAGSFLLLLVVTGFIWRQKTSVIRKATRYVNVLFLLLFFIEAAKAGAHWIAGNFNRKVVPLSLKPVGKAPKPDIYLLVMDEYAGVRSLKEKFGYDNSQFVDMLKGRGFFVAAAPNSNYNSTLFSLSSMLNLNYSNSFIKKELKDISAFGKAAKEIQDNQLVPFLRSNGYHIKNYSGFRIHAVPSGAFYFMAIEKRLALEKTFGSVLKNEIITRISSNTLQQIAGTHIAKVDAYNRSVFERVEQMIKLDRDTAPQFVYAHFFLPHEPFLNRKDGTARKYADAFYDKRRGRYKDAYVEYLQFANTRIEQVIKQIMQKEGEKIILLISDHGERFTEEEEKGSAFNNFFAVYNSQLNYSGFTDSFPLINTFRVVLNNSFNQNLPMLENRKLNVYTGAPEVF